MTDSLIHGIKIKSTERKFFIVYSNENKLGSRFQKVVLGYFDLWKSKGATSVFFFWNRNKRDEAKFLFLSPVFKNEIEFAQNDEVFINKQTRSIYWNGLIFENDRNSVKISFEKAKKSSLSEPVFDLYEKSLVDIDMNDWANLDLGREFSTGETLFAIREHLAKMEPLYVKYPGLRKREMEENVRLAEKLQRKYDEESGFSEQQMLSHSLAVHLPTTELNKGKILLSTLSRLTSNVLEIVNAQLDKLVPESKAVLAGLGTKSTVLLIDFEVNSTSTDGSILENRLQKSLSSIDYLYTRKRLEAKNKAEEFKEFIQADSKIASKIASSLQALTPTPDDEIDSITVSLPKSSVSVTLRSEDRRKMSIVKAFLDNHHEEDGKIEIFNGELGEPSGWLNKPDHKFKISTFDGEIISILHTKDLDEEIRKRYQSVVQVKAVNKKGKWHFVEWIEFQSMTSAPALS